MAEVLSLEPFQGSSLIAGQTGLSRRIEHVTVIEVPEPSRWSRRGALVLSTLYSCPDRECQRDLVVRLARNDAGVLAVHPAGPAPPHYDAIAGVANEIGFPVIKLHPDVPYLRIFAAVYGELLNRQAALLKSSESIYNRFTQLVVSGQDLRAVAEALHDILSNPVLVLDAEFSKRIAWGGPFDLAQVLARLIRAPEASAMFSSCARSAEPLSVFSLPWPEGSGGEQVRVFVAPIRPGGELSRYLVVGEMCRSVSEVGRLAIKHASTAVSFDVLRERAVLETERRLASGLLDDLLSGGPVSFESLVLKGDTLGMDLRGRRLVVFVGLCPRSDRAAGHQAGDRQALRPADALLHLAEVAVSHIDPAAIVAARADGVVALPSFHPGQSDPAAAAKARQFASSLADRLALPLRNARFHVGLGAMVDSPCRLRWSYETARWAVAAAARMGRDSGVVEYGDLGFYQLAAGSSDAATLDRFVDESLRAIHDGSGSDQHELMRTLETFLDCRESFVATAERLFVHPNTVKYRMEKIRRILPPEALTDPDRRLTLHLALKLRRLRP